jgi:capping protein alpha
MNANSIFDKMVLSKYGNKGDFSFDDPNAQSILEVDPVNFTLMNSSLYQVEDTERKRVQDEADKYVKSFYSKGIATVYGGPSQYVIFISSEKYNPDNYWNGKWVSEWKIDLDQNSLQASLKIHIHYFEDGNVQLKQSKSVDIKVQDNSIKNVFKAIQTAEQEIHTNLMMACSALCDNSFKGLRRALPLTKAKMDWAAIGNYKIGSELDKS